MSTATDDLKDTIIRDAYIDLKRSHPHLAEDFIMEEVEDAAESAVLEAEQIVMYFEDPIQHVEENENSHDDLLGAASYDRATRRVYDQIEGTVALERVDEFADDMCRALDRMAERAVREIA